MPSLKSSSQLKNNNKKSSKYEKAIYRTIMRNNIPIQIHKNVPKEITEEIERGNIDLDIKETDIRIDITMEKERIIVRHRQINPEECDQSTIRRKKGIKADLLFCKKGKNWVLQSILKPLKISEKKMLDGVNTIDHIPSTAIFLTSMHKGINFPLLCVEGKKHWIIKSIPLGSHKDELLYAVDHQNAYGIVKIKSNSEEITYGSDEWKAIRNDYNNHRIPPELFDEWFKGKDIYIYQCEPIVKYIHPFQYHYEQGVQTFDLNPKIKTIIEDVPELKQKDDYTCTEASANMIYAFYNYHIPDLDYLSQKCDTLDILAPCMYPKFKIKSFGMRKGGTKETATIELLKNEINMGRPLLIRFQYPGQKDGDGHTVVVIGYNEKGIFFNDPSKDVYPSRQFYSYDQFETLWNRTNRMAMFLQPKGKF